MKYIILYIFLILVISTNAQNNSDTAKLQHYPVDVENKFIIPEYTNQIVDAEKFFSENEIKLLHKSIDSIFKSTKLKLQVAFVTPEYYENNSSKFDLFATTLEKKWGTVQDEARLLLIVSMSDKTAIMRLSGNKLKRSFRNLIEIVKENREPTEIEKRNMENFGQLLDKILFEEAMLGVNLKSKNYVKALKDYFSAIIKNVHLFFDLN
jgi:uncharacterized membrane protein YgcG